MSTLYGLRDSGDPGIPHPERLAPAITAPRQRRRGDAGRIASFIAGLIAALALVAGVL